MNSADFLFELWVEELPVSYIKGALAQVKPLAEEQFSANGLIAREVKCYGTPNRIILYAEDMPLANPKEEKIIFGPPEKAVFDQNGEYTVQASGFARKYGAAPKKIQIINAKAALKISTGGRKAKNILAEILPLIISKIEFPKTMIWDESVFKFARPIRNIYCVLGSEVVNFRVAGVKSSNKTIGLHVANPGRTTAVKTPKSYFEKIRNMCVLIDPAERKKIIHAQSLEALRSRKAHLIKDEKLTEEIAFLCENPVAVLGEFKAEYLKLPKEALICCMKDKQRFLCASDDKGNLLGLFVGFRNGYSEHQGIVREGFERVLDARLSDVNFFFSKDLKSAFEAKLERLKGITQNEKLGSLYDKTLRIVKLAGILADKTGLPAEEKSNLLRAAELSKADLASDMVFEYPELQGIMGGIYAKLQTEKQQVSDAVYEHYMPVFSESPIPKTKIGKLLALADKTDTLSSSFILGYIPKGSGDPFGLRRMVLGIIRIILESGIKVGLEFLAERSLSLFGGNLQNNFSSALAAELEFIKQRLAVYFASCGADYDIVEAVLAGGRWAADIEDAGVKISALSDVRRQRDFEPFILLFRRAANILSQASALGISFEGGIREDLLAEGEEKDLFGKCRGFSGMYAELMNSRDYKKLFSELVEFKTVLNGFFDKVLVMAEDPQVKTNRLSLIYKFKSFFDPLADFTKIVLNSEKPSR